MCPERHAQHPGDHHREDDDPGDGVAHQGDEVLPDDGHLDRSGLAEAEEGRSAAEHDEPTDPLAAGAIAASRFALRSADRRFEERDVECDGEEEEDHAERGDGER